MSTYNPEEIFKTVEVAGMELTLIQGDGESYILEVKDEEGYIHSYAYSTYEDASDAFDIHLIGN